MSVDNKALDPRKCEVLIKTAEWLTGLHGLFYHLYFSVLRDYLKKKKTVTIAGLAVFSFFIFYQTAVCFCVEDNGKRHLSVALYLFVFMCFILEDERTLGINHEDFLIFRF